MAKVSSFDPATCRLTTAQIVAALQPLAAELGITIKQGRGSYTASSFSLKVECAVAGENGAPAGREADAFRQMAHFYGLQADDLGRTFSIPQGSFTISGLSTRSPKRPVLATAKDGRTFKFTEKSVQIALGRPRQKG